MVVSRPSFRDDCWYQGRQSGRGGHGGGWGHTGQNKEKMGNGISHIQDGLPPVSNPRHVQCSVSVPPNSDPGNVTQAGARLAVAGWGAATRYKVTPNILSTSPATAWPLPPTLTLQLTEECFRTP